MACTVYPEHTRSNRCFSEVIYAIFFPYVQVQSALHAQPATDAELGDQSPLTDAKPAAPQSLPPDELEMKPAAPQLPASEDASKGSRSETAARRRLAQLTWWCQEVFGQPVMIADLAAVLVGGLGLTSASQKSACGRRLH